MKNSARSLLAVLFLPLCFACESKPAGQIADAGTFPAVEGRSNAATDAATANVGGWTVATTPAVAPSDPLTTTVAADLAASKKYGALWAPQNVALRDKTLTAVSQALGAIDASFSTRVGPLYAASAGDRLKAFGKMIPGEDAETVRIFMGLSTIVVTTRAFPSDFADHAKEVIASKVAEPHKGVWNESGRDWAALAAMLTSDVTYLHELVALRQSKKVGIAWEGGSDATFPTFARERDALEAIEKAGGLTQPESLRLAQLKASKLDGAFPAAVTAEAVVADYDNNEVRGDEHYKGKVVALTGKVFGIVKSPLGNTYLQMVSEFPTRGLHCQMNDAFVSTAAALDKGQQIRVRGRVSGLIMRNVLVTECEL